jgi:hypothetical protein
MISEQEQNVWDGNESATISVFQERWNERGIGGNVIAPCVDPTMDV